MRLMKVQVFLLRAVIFDKKTNSTLPEIYLLKMEVFPLILAAIIFVVELSVSDGKNRFINFILLVFGRMLCDSISQSIRYFGTMREETGKSRQLIHSSFGLFLVCLSVCLPVSAAACAIDLFCLFCIKEVFLNEGERKCNCSILYLCFMWSKPLSLENGHSFYFKFNDCKWYIIKPTATEIVLFNKTRPDTRLPKSRAGGQGPYLWSPDHLGRSSGVKK